MGRSKNSQRKCSRISISKQCSSNASQRYGPMSTYLTAWINCNGKGQQRISGDLQQKPELKNYFNGLALLQQRLLVNRSQPTAGNFFPCQNLFIISQLDF